MPRLKPVEIMKVLVNTGNGFKNMELQLQNIMPMLEPKEKLLKRSPTKITRLSVLKLKNEKPKERQMHNMSFQKM